MIQYHYVLVFKDQKGHIQRRFRPKKKEKKDLSAEREFI